MLEEDCNQIIDDYTRIREVNGVVQRSCLDHVTVNCINKIINCTIIGVGQSDHLGILVTKMSREMRMTPRTTKKRIYKNFVAANFVEDIKTAKENGLFSAMHETDDIDEAGDIFVRVFNEILDKHAPIKTIQNRTNYVPYLTNDIKNLMKQRDTLKEEAAKSGNINIHNQYKELRNRVTTKLKTAKVDYYKEKFEQNDMSSSELWKAANQVLGKVRSTFPSQIVINNKLLSKPIEMCTAMNEFFIKKISDLKTGIVQDTSEDELEVLRNYVSSKNLPDDGFRLKEINEEETLEIIKSLKGKKSIGLDWICGFSLKLAAPILISEIRTLVNLTIRHGKYYTKWKYTKVLPGWKNKGTRHEAKYYRPISNICELSKIAEKAVYQQVYDYLFRNLIDCIYST